MLKIVWHLVSNEIALSASTFVIQIKRSLFEVVHGECPPVVT